MGKPEIRFKGYTDEWEQRKLGDLVDRVTRKNQDLVSELWFICPSFTLLDSR